MKAPAPLALLAELTHRCPMRCVYCSNPLALEPRSRELDTDIWCRVLEEAADLGALQVHFSGGEPAARRDLVDLIAHATKVGLYSNLITSGILLERDDLKALAQAGLEHVQLSIQDVDASMGDTIGGLPHAQERKQLFAQWVRDAGLALTVNAVVHRHNLARLSEMITLAHAWGAGRVEVAHVQYYGWAFVNRAALIPTREQLDIATEVVAAAQDTFSGVMTIDYVIPDYYARRPKACMGGWGQRFINVDPSGRVLPCHAATTIPNLVFETVHQRSLEQIWADSPAFNRFRGTDWMPEPCRSCERREVDWGGCRCQALALTGEASNTDPACHKSAYHNRLAALADHESHAGDRLWIYRGQDKNGSISRHNTLMTTGETCKKF